MKKLFTLLTMLILCIGSMWGQQAVLVGKQIKSEGGITSGKAYILKTGANRYITDNGTNYDVPNSANSATEASVYYLISNGDGTWKIKNLYTGKYWGVPVYNANLASADEASAGAWSLNFSENIAYPSAPDASSTVRGIDRSGGKVYGWTTGTNDNHKVYIYEVAIPPFAEYYNLIVESSPVATITTGTWYVMSQRSRTSYVFEDVNTNKLKHTLTKPTGSAANKANFLVRLISGDDGKYYLQTGLGNYVGEITASTQVPTTAQKNQQLTIAKISNTDGHYYVQCASNNVILDANDFTGGDPATVVGWGTTAPTSTGGNNDWAFYPVTFQINSSSSDVWTINNTKTSRGAMMYYPTGSEKYVWSSGKSGSFNADDNNCRWILYPAGIEDQYYLYNVGAQKFAVPTGSNSSQSLSSWEFSEKAVPVTFVKQDDGTHRIRSAQATNVYAAVSNNYSGPIINYDDVGCDFTLVKVDNASETVTTQLTTAMSKLIDGQTKLTSLPTGTGWYAIKIRYNNSNLYGTVYTFSEETTNNTTSYPLGYFSTFNTQPYLSEAQYYVKLTKKSDNNYSIQLPNGKYIQNSTGKPVSGTTEQANYISYDSNNHFILKSTSGGYFYRPYNLSGYSPTTYFIGETGTSGSTYYDIYPINLTTAGLTAWSVSIEESEGTETLTCGHANVSGLSTVYNNGYIFLPTGTTPTASDFSVSGVNYGYQIKVLNDYKMIAVVNIDKIFNNYKDADKFNILEGSTVQGPDEIDAPESINDAIDAANALTEPTTEDKIEFIESENGEMIQKYLDMNTIYGPLATIYIDMKGKEYGTMILPCPCTRIDGLDIYSCNSSEDNVLTLNSVSGNYAQEVPYIIHATEGSKYTIIGWDKGSTATHTVGWLTGVLNSETYITDGSYMLATNKTTGVQAFYKVSGNGVTCAKNKCYLTVPNETQARTLYLDIDGEITAIEEVFGDETEQGAIYNLAGQRLTKAQKGINIINGKKIIK